MKKAHLKRILPVFFWGVDDPTKIDPGTTTKDELWKIISIFYSPAIIPHGRNGTITRREFNHRYVTALRTMKIDRSMAYKFFGYATFESFERTTARYTARSRFITAVEEMLGPPNKKILHETDSNAAPDVGGHSDKESLDGPGVDVDPS